MSCTRSTLSLRTRAVAILALCALLSPAGGAAEPGAPQDKTQAAVNATAPMATAEGATPGQPTAPTTAEAASVAALPAPLPPELLNGIDADAQAKAMLAHLNDVIRFYRQSVAPIQRVGEVSDSTYAEQAQARAVEVTQLAFRSARGQASFLARVVASQNLSGHGDTSRIGTQARETAQKLADLQQQDSAMQAAATRKSKTPEGALDARRADVEGQIKVDKALFDALSKLATGPNSRQTELQRDIDGLQHSVPEIIDDKQKLVAPTIDSVGSLREKGVTTQTALLFQLVGTEGAINDEIAEVDSLKQQAITLRAPLVKILQATLAASAALQSGTQLSSASPAEKLKRYNELADTFVALSDVAVPVSQELLILEQTKANLVSWRGAVAAERHLILHSLLMRLACIAGALLLLFIASEIWRRYANRYIKDLRRRSHILVIRRMVIGFLTLIVLTVGFVTQFSSLATFAGFISAGIAVGLQTILLSVAAYFFIVGRFGVKVGDRITVSNVTGDVVNVTLVRFYMMELAGTGTDMHPTGRIAVFANSVLFQTGNPIYKQIPGTEYVWHQLTYKLKSGVEYTPVAQCMKDAVETVFATYRGKLEQQHKDNASWMDVPLPAPKIDARFQMVDGPEYTVLYPVEITEAANVDEQVVRTLMKTISQRPDLQEIVEGLPTVKPIIRPQKS